MHLDMSLYYLRILEPLLSFHIVTDCKYMKILIAIFASIQTIDTMYRLRNYEIGSELEVNIWRAVVNVIQILMVYVLYCWRAKSKEMKDEEGNGVANEEEM